MKFVLRAVTVLALVVVVLSGHNSPVATAQNGFADPLTSTIIDPRLWTLHDEPNSSASATVDGLALTLNGTPAPDGVSLDTNCLIIGDYDAAVDYILDQWPSGNLGRIGLGDINGPVERNEEIGYLTHFPDGIQGGVATNDSAGRLRMKRTGSNLEGYYWDGQSWVFIDAYPSGSTEPTKLSVALWDGASGSLQTTVRLRNFAVISDGLQCPDSDEDGPDDLNDNCYLTMNTGQENADADLIDLSPPKAYDDVSSPDSDVAGDACDDDDDNDGRTDIDEVNGVGCAGAETNSLMADTDGDHAIDGAECALGTDPNNVGNEPSIAACGAVTDMDGDKVLAFREICYYGTDPNVANTDGDTRDDSCEVYSINGDLTVNVIDLQQIASESGSYVSPGSAVKVDFDVTKDGSINVIDLQQVAAGDGVCP